MTTIQCSRNGISIELSEIQNGDDLTGLKIGRILVLGPVGKNIQRTRWIIECDCGIRKERIGADVRNGRHQSCGGKKCKHFLDDRIGVLINMVIHAYSKGSSRRTKCEFSLTRKEVQELVLGDCAYCGAKPVPMFGFRTSMNLDPYPSNGIDRVDNQVGYTKANCVSCCTMCNRLKRNLDLEDFFSHIRKILERAKFVRYTLDLNPAARARLITGFE